jgi:PAS domain S-box-containing protein/putative nucleotidyltransferase with HDIG domain
MAQKTLRFLITTVMLPLFFLLFLPATGEGKEDTCRILLLNSYHDGFSWTDGITKGIRETLQSSGKKVSLSVEYMDTKRYGSITAFSAFADYFESKYEASELDLILCSDDDAFSFLLRMRRRILGEVPLVFCGVNNPQLASYEKSGLVAGLIEKVDISGTAELALRLFPETEHIALVSDLSTTGMTAISQAREELFHLSNKVSIIDIFGLTATELQAEVSLLPPKTVVLILVYFQDANGRFYPPERSVSVIKKACPFPVFGLWGMMVEGGVLGGSVILSEKHGASAAGIALKILDGTEPSSLPVESDTSLIPVFYYPEMVRHGLTTRDIPAGSVVLDGPGSFFFRHWKLILVNLVLLFAACLYVVTLLLNEKRKKIAEKDLEMKKAQWEGLFHNTPVACVVFNSGNDITSVNESFCSLFGYEREEVLGKNLDQIVADYPGLNQEAEAISGKVLSGEPVTGESLRRKKDGTLFPVEYQGVTFPLEKGSFMGYAIYRDISDQKKSEDKIRHNLRKESLISSVSARLLEEGVDGGLPSSFMEVASFLGAGRGGMIELDENRRIARELSLSGGMASFQVPPGAASAISPGDVEQIAGYLWEKGKIEIGSRRNRKEKDMPWADSLLEVWGEPLFVQPVYSGGAVKGWLALMLPSVPLPHSEEAFAAMFCDLAGSAFYREKRISMMAEANRMLDEAAKGVVGILGHALAMKDPYTVGHQINVANLAQAMAKRGGYDETFQETVYYAGLVHDLGKITIPSSILSKPGRLSEIEFSIIRNHALYGWEILSSADLPWPLADIVIQHHEHIDGSGYPFGLQGDAICREARFLSVADVVEAISSDRPYRPGFGIGKAFDEIRENRGSWYDPEASDLCIEVIEEGFSFDRKSYKLFIP